MFTRRIFTAGVGYLALGGVTPLWADEFDDFIETTLANEEAVYLQKANSERMFVVFRPSAVMLRRRPDLPRTFRSPLNRSISARTKKLLIISEVTSQFVYEKKYRSPLWPGGKSGVTIGVGYDMGYVSKEDFKTDWIGLIPNRDIERLSACCEVRGPKCAQLAIRLSDIKIEWSIAERQFESFVKLYMNLVRVTFPGSEELSDECFGALTSLVYNRGNRMDREEGDPIDRRKEMREIRDLIKSKKYSLIPNRLRAMKRIWVGDPDSRGLLDRREAEARLFEIGMKG